MGLTDDERDRVSAGTKAHDASDAGMNVGFARDSTQDQLVTMKKEIDSLQIAMGESNRPWYRQASTIIAVVAVLLSLGTTYYSSRQARLQNIHNAKVELRGLIKEIESASLANVDIRNKYKNNAAALELAGSLVRTRQIVLVSQATDIIDSIPDEVTATEYYAVGSALSTISPQRVLSYYERGLAKADNVDSYLGISHSLGLHYFSIGDYERGRSSFTQALTSHDRFGQSSESLRRYHNAFTYYQWAAAELSIRNCPAANKHHEESLRLFQQLSSQGVDYSTYIAQLIAQEQLIRKQCQ
jgi:tetratricopeptide (TPR) repeat protein